MRRRHRMCKGHIVEPPGMSKTEVKKSLAKFLKNFLERIIYYPAVVDYDQLQVNMCLKCGDLQVDGDWLKIPHPQKPIISQEVKFGRITINGSLTICHFCVSMEKEIKRKRKNLYADQQSSLEIFPVSSASF